MTQKKTMRVMFALSLLPIAMAVWASEPVRKLPEVAMQRVQVNLGVGCRFAVTLPVSADGGVGQDFQKGTGAIAVKPLPKKWRAKKQSLDFIGLSIRCVDGQSQFESTGLANFNSQKQIWEKNISKRFELDGEKLSLDEYQVYDQATRIYNITEVNIKGYAATEDDVIGDEEKRQRYLSFCLFHSNKALCGSGTVAYLSDGPKGDLTKYALEMIRSIEFLDDAAPAAGK